MRGLSAKDERNNSDFYPAVFCFTTLLHSKKPYVMRLKGNYYRVTKQVSELSKAKLGQVTLNIVKLQIN